MKKMLFKNVLIKFCILYFVLSDSQKKVFWRTICFTLTTATRFRCFLWFQDLQSSVVPGKEISTQMHKEKDGRIVNDRPFSAKSGAPERFILEGNLRLRIYLDAKKNSLELQKRASPNNIIWSRIEEITETDNAYTIKLRWSGDKNRYHFFRCQNMLFWMILEKLWILLKVSNFTAISYWPITLILYWSIISDHRYGPIWPK